MPDKQLREKLQAHLKLKNCLNMGVPHTNQEMFNVLQPQIRKAVIRLSNTQQSIIRAAVAITKCADWLLAIHPNTKKAGTAQPNPLSQVSVCIENLAYALVVTGDASKDISQKRRDLHRSKLPAEATWICAQHVNISAEWLSPHVRTFTSP